MKKMKEDRTEYMNNYREKQNLKEQNFELN